jgi:outer membrane protein assembly factor BamB
MGTFNERQQDADIRPGEPPVLQPSLEAGVRAGPPALRPLGGVGRRPTRPFLAVMGVLLAILVTLGMLQVFSRSDPYGDPRLLTELARTNFTDPSYPQTTDWPQWRGPNRDGVSGETGLLTAWPQGGPNALWKIDVGRGYSSVSVVGDRLYTMMQDGKDEAVVCLSTKDGTELWRTRYPARFTSQGEGPRSTPAVDSDRVYTVGATGMMHCLKTHPKDRAGEIVWSKNLLDEFGARNLQWGVSFSPLVDGNLVYVSPGGTSGNSVVALDKYTGAVRWHKLDDAPSYSSPVLATLAGKRQILFFTGAGLVGLDPDTGDLLWRFAWQTSYDCNIATPIVAGDYVFISSGYKKGCAMLKIAGKSGGRYEARLVYTNTDMTNHFASSVRHGNHVYGIDEDSKLRCLDLRSGHTAWTQTGFGKGSLTIADGHLIILGDNGKLALAEATPQAYREKSGLRISHTRCWVVPVLSAGRLYIRDQDKLMCLDVRGP